MHACVRSFHFILLEIKLDRGVLTVLDSRQKDPKEYVVMTEVSSIDHYRTISATLFMSSYQVIIIFFVSQGLESVHRKSFETAGEAAIYTPESKYY